MRTVLLPAGFLLAFLAGWGARGVSTPEAERIPLRTAELGDSKPQTAPELLGRGSRMSIAGPTRTRSVNTGQPPKGTAPTGANDAVVVEGADASAPETDLARARALVARMRPLLDRGGASPLDLWRALEAATESGEHDWIYSDSSRTAAARHEWTRFLAEHESEVTEFLEAAYRLMSESQLDPEDVTLSGLGLLAPDLGSYLIATLPPKRLRTLRDVLRTLVGTPEAFAKENRHSSRAELDRILVAWAASTSAAEARRELDGGRTTAAEAVALLDRIPENEISDQDPAAMAARLLLETGDWDQFNSSLRFLDVDGVEPAASAIEHLDAAVHAFTRDSVRTDHPRRLWHYLSATARGGWPDAEPFLESGLEVGGHALTHIPLVLGHLQPKPPAQYVRAVLARYKLPKHVREALRKLLSE